MVPVRACVRVCLVRGARGAWLHGVSRAELALSTSTWSQLQAARLAQRQKINKKNNNNNYPKVLYGSVESRRNAGAKKVALDRIVLGEQLWKQLCS